MKQTKQTWQPTALVIADDADVRESFELVFETIGFRLGQPCQQLAAWRCPPCGERVDVALLCLGYDSAAALDTITLLLSLPVFEGAIVLLATTLPEHMWPPLPPCGAAKIVRYLSFPVDLDDFEDLVQRMCSQQGHRVGTELMSSGLLVAQLGAA